MRVYADNAATTYLSKTARDKLIQCLDEFNGNPNSLHSDGQRTQEALDEARAIGAECINAARPNEIYFTSGGSEADNQALLSAARGLKAKGKKHLITLNIAAEGFILLSINRAKDSHLQCPYVFSQV